MIVVPAYYVFVVGQITFKGHCNHNLTFQVSAINFLSVTVGDDSLNFFLSCGMNSFDRELSTDCQIDGTIIPTTDLEVWDRLPNKVQWIGFYKQVGLTVRGSGIINGLGELWWRQPCKVCADFLHPDTQLQKIRSVTWVK